MNIALALLLSCLHQVKVQAFPGGAGGCEGGMPAVMGLHLSAATVTNGSLALFNMTVDIDGVILDPSQVFTFEPGVNHVLQVLAPQQNLRGVLMRVQAAEGIDTSMALLPFQRTKLAEVCIAPVVGITHFKDNDKSDVSGLLRFDEEVDPVFIDITTVIRNSDSVSEYAYNRYVGRVVSSGPTAPGPIAGPAAAPVAPAPIAAPVVAPAAPAPTAAPVAAPVAAPTAIVPSSPPSAPPVTLAPTQAAPSFPPTDQPIAQPSDQPSDVPSDVPSLTPTVTMAPTGAFVYCAYERTILEACFEIYLSDSRGECDNCVANSIPGSVRSCNELNRVMCAAVTEGCECQRCERFVISYLDCAFRVTIACGIDCDDDGE